MSAYLQLFDETLGRWIGSSDVDGYINSNPNSVVSEKYRYVDDDENKEPLENIVTAPPAYQKAAHSIKTRLLQGEVANEFTSNATGTYTTKVTLVTPALDVGTYRIAWAYTWCNTLTTSSVDVRILMNGSELWQVDPNPPTADTKYPAAAVTHFYNNTVDTVYTFVMEFRQLGGGEAILGYSCIEFFRTD